MAAGDDHREVADGDGHGGNFESRPTPPETVPDEELDSTFQGAMYALQRERGRLADVGTAFDGVLAVGGGDVPPDADAHLPALPDGVPAHRPATLEGTGSFTASVTQATNVLLPETVDQPKPESALGRLEALGDRIRP